MKTTVKQRKYAREFRKRMVASGLCIAGCMKPLEKPLTRRCNQPFLFVTVSASGQYLLCCQDGLQVTKGKFGSVNEGLEGFNKFWYGKEMQTVRRRLRMKNRAGTDYACKKCNITFSRCDFKHWTDEQVDTYFDGKNHVGFTDSEKAAIDAVPKTEVSVARGDLF